MNGYLQQQGLNRVQFSMQSCSSWFSVPSSTCVSLPVSLGDKEDIWLCDSLGTDCPGLGLAVLAHCGVVELERMSHELHWTHPKFSPVCRWRVPWSRECPQLLVAPPNSSSLEQGMSLALGCHSKFLFPVSLWKPYQHLLPCSPPALCSVS